MWEFLEGTAAAVGTDEGRVTMYVLKVRAIQTFVSASVVIIALTEKGKELGTCAA